VWSSSSVILGLCLAGASSLLSAHCDPEIPCFGAVYRVEFIERLSESTCEAAWAEDWTFTVSPLSEGGGEQCGIADLEILEPDLPRSVINGGPGTVFPSVPTLRAGSVTENYPVEASDGCTAKVALSAWIPEGFRDVAAAAEQDAVIWEVPVVDVNEACGVAIPEFGYCSEFYRTRMTKVSDLAKN
jgi:hypothetical protein